MYDHLSAALASIYRCSKQRQLSTIVSNTKLIRQVLLILVRLGYLRGFTILNPYKLRVFIKFDENKNPLIRTIQRVSKNGARVYVSCSKLAGLNKNNSIIDSYKSLILSTSKGLLTTHEAVLLKQGGELLFIVN